MSLEGLDRVGTAFNPRGLTVLRMGDEPDDATPFDEYSPTERDAVKWFVDHEEALFETIVEALRVHVEKREEEERRDAERRARVSAQNKAAFYGEDVDDDTGVVVEKEVRELFDDPEEVVDELDGDDELEEDEPFWTRFDFEAMILLPDKVKGGVALGFAGKADWDPEQGVAVILEGEDVEQIGPRNLIL